jgi:hypothetical protein
MDLVKGETDLGNATQRPCTDHAIKGVIRPGKPRTVKHATVNVNIGLPEAPSGDAMHSRACINRVNVANVLRIVTQVQAGPKADFQYMPPCTGQKRPPIPIQKRHAQNQVAYKRKDGPRIKAHGSLMSIRPISVSPDFAPSEEDVNALEICPCFSESANGRCLTPCRDSHLKKTFRTLSAF